MGASKYISDDDERERLLQTIPPGNVRARGVYGSESGILEAPEVYKSRWRSTRVMYLTMFLSSVSFSICMSSLYPYLKILDHTATTDFLGWVVAAYSVGQLVASPLFGFWSNCRKRSREPIVISLIVNVIANVLYMYLESVSSHRAALLVVARVFVGFGAGNVAVVRSYVSGATTLKERTPAMANMSAFQAVGFIIGPVIQTAMVPIGYPGPIHSPALHLDMYTATALLSAIVGVINIVLLIVVFKEHTVPDEVLVPDIQGSVNDDVDESEEIPLDYLAVISSITLFFSVLFIFAVFETMATPLAMHMFAWTKSQATLLIGVMLGCAGAVSIVVFIFIKILSKRFNERYLLFGGFILCLVGFIIYLPWGSHYPDIQYADYTTLRPAPTGSTNVSTYYTDITFQFTAEQISDLEANATVKSKGIAFSNAFSEQETIFVSQSEGSGGTHTRTLTTHSHVDTTVNKTTVVMQTTTAVSMTTHKGTERTQNNSTQPSEHTTNYNKTTAPAETTKVRAQTTTVPAQTTSTAVQTGDHTTAEGATTEVSPTHVPTVENTTKEAVGCPYYYDWCFNTPAILLWQFLLGTFFVAVGYPVCNVMSYTIYSKILGPKPQGIWMGCLTAAGSLARTLGPVFVSQVYDAYGPRVTFISMCVLIVLTVAGFLLVCRRLVPYTAITTVIVK